LDQTWTVHVATAPNEPIALMWRDVLAHEGIIALLKPGGAGYSYGHNALNEHYILVRDDQADLARQVLADFGEAEFVDDEVYDDENVEEDST
jgi:hypothetical protein